MQNNETSSKAAPKKNRHPLVFAAFIMAILTVFSTTGGELSLIDNNSNVSSIRPAILSLLMRIALVLIPLVSGIYFSRRNPSRWHNSISMIIVTCMLLVVNIAFSIFKIKLLR